MKIFLTLFAMTLVSHLILFSGTTGKIAGTVTDANNNEALIGVNIVIIGTSMGAATDFEGNYSIINVPPGIYSLRASALGHGNQVVQNVRVSIDLTTNVNFSLSEEVLELGKEVVITAERPLVQKDLTAKTAVVSGDDIKALPVTEVGQILSLQAGYVGGSLRGGRKPGRTRTGDLRRVKATS